MISYKNAFLYFSFLHQDDDSVMETPLWKLADELDDSEGSDGRDWMSRDGPLDSTVTDGVAVEGGGMEPGEGIGVGDLRHYQEEAPKQGFYNVSSTSDAESMVDGSSYKYGGVCSEDDLNRGFHGDSRRQEAVSMVGEETRDQGGTTPEIVQDGVSLDRRACEDQFYDQVTAGTRQPGDALTSRREESPPIPDWFEEEFGIARDPSGIQDEHFPAGVLGRETGTVETRSRGQDAIDSRGFESIRPPVGEAYDMEGVVSSRGEGWKVRDDRAVAAAENVLYRGNAEPPPISGIRDEFGEEVQHDVGIGCTEGEHRKKRKKRRYLDLEVFCDDEDGEELRIPPVRLDMRSDSRGTGVSRDAEITKSAKGRGFMDFGRMVRGMRSTFETYLELGQDDVDDSCSEGGGDVIAGKTVEEPTNRIARDSDKER